MTRSAEGSARRRWWLAGAAVAVIAVGTWGVIGRGNRADTKTPSVPQATAAASSMAGMNMTPGGNVMLSASQLQEFGVTFGVAEVRQLTAETRTTGVVTFDETRLTQVSPRIGGFVERLRVNATGQQVRRGEPLLEIYSPDLVAAQQELLLAAQLQRDMGRSAVPGVPGNTSDLVAATRRRLQLLDISDGQIDEILRTGTVRRTLTLFAPASGIIVEKNVLQGQAISAGDALYTIADVGNVWIDIQLREGAAAAVRVGTGADVELTGSVGLALKGRVAYIYPILDSVTRAVRARVSIANANGVLKPGMYATVRLSTPTRSTLAVPSSAILRTGDRDVIFMDMGKGELMPMDVKTGATVGGYTEIVSGLNAGARVVTSAQFLLDSEANLGEVMKSMISQGTAAGASGASDMKDMPGMAVPAVPKR